MKSCLGILLVFFTFVAFIGGGALIWYLSSTSEFSRKGAAATSPPASKTAPVTPSSAPKPTPTTAPKPAPVR